MSDIADRTTRTDRVWQRSRIPLPDTLTSPWAEAVQRLRVLHRELLDRKRWINNDDFSLCFALARLTQEPIFSLLHGCWVAPAGYGRRGNCVACRVDSLCDHRCGRDSIVSHWQDNHWAQQRSMERSLPPSPSPSKRVGRLRILTLNQAPESG